ncbi:hypothetical protein DFH94DRAFT_123417 [Russula ochroleuca]|uniref:Uncharacterized protein n=1 Tax=Russula ochroleuca TaxID=152965 RepID=A0A9P5MNY8_9AGAM|nr:hypothetical protein DFH94DRAFT_123417 [Russula ochroleuca]
MQPASPFTPSQAIPSARLSSHAWTTSRLLLSNGTVPVLPWFSDVRKSSARRGFRLVDLRTSLACSHTVMPNFLGPRGLPLVMWVSAPAKIKAKILFARADRLVTANPCQPTRSRSSSMAHQSVESDLFEAIVLSVVLLRSGRSLGDSLEDILFLNSPLTSFFGHRY